MAHPTRRVHAHAPATTVGAGAGAARSVPASPLSRAWALLRRDGAGAVARALRRRVASRLARLGDGTFDRRWGLDTRGIVETFEMEDVRSPNRVHGLRYEPTPVRPLRRVLREAGIPLRGTFVDMGCGRGRVLVVAAEHGFERIVGVDYSPRLCETAQSNAARYRARGGRPSRIEVVCADAAQWQPPDDATIFYFFHPFHAPVFARVLDAIDRSVERRPRRVYVVQLYPADDDCLAGRAGFVRVYERSWGKWVFRVYRRDGVSRADSHQAVRAGTPSTEVSAAT